MSCNSHLGQTKIGELDITLAVNEHIFWLQISVENVQTVQMLEGKKDVGCVELCSVLLKSTNLTQVEEELTTWAVLKGDIQLALSLECIVHLDNKIVVYTFLNIIKRRLKLMT